MGRTIAVPTVNSEKPMARASPGEIAAIRSRPMESPDRAPKMTIMMLGGINCPMFPDAAIKP